MNVRVLFAVPFALAAASAVAWGAAGALGLPPGAALTAGVESAKLLAFVGSVLAARAFEPGDYMRRAWVLIAGSTVLLFTRDVAALAALPAALQGFLATAGNASSVAGTWMLARAWNVSGLEETEDEPRRGHALQAVAVVVALLVTGWPLVSHVRALAGGQAFALVPLASDVADLVVLALLAPLLRTAVALSGGVLRWPWALLTLANLLWLVFDATYGVLGLLHVDPARAQAGTELLRVLATTFAFSAGLAQKWAVAPQPSQRAPAP